MIFHFNEMKQFVIWRPQKKNRLSINEVFECDFQSPEKQMN